jgi:hypothetical protein
MNAPLALPQEHAAPALAHAIDTASLLLNPVTFQQLDAFATMMASGIATVPKHLQKNKADCMAVTIQAMQWRKNPFGVAQKTHVVNGTLGYESQLIISIVNTSGAIVGSLEFEWFGEWDRIIGKFKEIVSKKKFNEDTNEPLKYRVPDWSMQEEEGLYVVCRAALSNSPGKVREMKLLMTQARVRNSTLWADDPKMQLAYLAGKKWARLNCPEVILGMYSPDELAADPRAPQDMGAAEVVEPLKPQPLTAEELAAWKAESSKGTAASRAWLASFPGPRRRLVSDAIKAEVWAIAEAAEKRRTVDAGSASAPTADGAQAAGAPAPVDDPFVTELKAAEEAARRAGEGAMGHAHGGAA